MVDFAKIPKYTVLDPRDRDHLFNLTKHLHAEAKQLMPVFLDLLATMPRVTEEQFAVTLEKAKTDLDSLAQINRKAQAIVRSFEPAYPLVSILTLEPTEV